MELKQLTDETLKLFDVPDTSNLSEKMLEIARAKQKDYQNNMKFFLADGRELLCFQGQALMESFCCTF